MASIHPDKGQYRVAYSLSIGQKRRQKTKRFKNRADARRFLRQVESVEEAVRLGSARLDDIEEWVARRWLSHDDAMAAFRGYRETRQAVPDVADVDLAKIRAAYEAYALVTSKAGDASRKSHQNHMNLADQVLAFLADTHPTLSLTERDVQTWVDALRQQYSEWTVHHQLTKMRLLFDQAMRLGMMPDNPARRVKIGTPKTETVRRVLSLDEAQQLLDCSLGYRERLSGGLPTLVRLGLYAGLRDEEMCWCQWEWIDPKQRILTVRPTVAPSGERWSPKDSEVRRLDIKEVFVEYLRAERKRQEQAGILGPFVLVAGHSQKTQYRGRPLNPSSLSHAFRAMADAEGLDASITIYSLRHTYATNLLRAGVDIATVKERMGHADIRTTMQYLHAMAAEAHPTDALPY